MSQNAAAPCNKVTLWEQKPSVPYSVLQNTSDVISEPCEGR